jgi:hypothetical protein
MLGRRNKAYAWIIGIGILLFIIHNPDQPLIQYLFLPQVGMIITVMATLYCLLDNRKSLTLGSKFIWIPLAIISLSITASSIWQYFTTDIEFMKALTPAMFGWILFGLYLVARILGETLFKPFTYLIIIEAISLVVYGIMYQGVKTGGLISPTNYDIATGVLLVGIVVSAIKYRWWLCAIALVGLFFTGADEALFGVVILAIAILIRRDISKKMWLPVGALVIVVVISTIFGITQKLYYPTLEKFAAVQDAMTGTKIGSIVNTVIPDVITDKFNEIAQANPVIVEAKDDNKSLDYATGYRWNTHWNLSEIKPFGYGYNINNFYLGIPHNIALIIIEQVGILAALAWLFVSFYCIVKTKWKYVFVIMITLGIVDHYFWTEFAPFFPIVLGIASTSFVSVDHIFKKQPVIAEPINCQEAKDRLKRMKFIANGG